MSATEYGIVSGVFGDTLPYRSRIMISNAAGLAGRPFTIPTSLISAVAGLHAISFVRAAALGYIGSLANAAYLINAGADYDLLATTERRLLVHETAHVWQGKNSTFALSYVFSSVVNQALKGGAAYSYTAGQPWKSYNAEQQAAIVEDWFASGQPSSGPLYPYIVNHVRTGDA